VTVNHHVIILSVNKPVSEKIRQRTGCRQSGLSAKCVWEVSFLDFNPYVGWWWACSLKCRHVSANDFLGAIHAYQSDCCKQFAWTGPSIQETCHSITSIINVLLSLLILLFGFDKSESETLIFRNIV